MSQINFGPWIGTDFYNPGWKGRRVLVLGESHYCKGDLDQDGCCFPSCTKEKMKAACHTMTCDVVNDFLYKYKGSYHQRTFVCFERAVTGKVLDFNERESFWNSVAFYNYMQHSQKGPRHDVKILSDYSDAFVEIVKMLDPDRIIVWGKRLYHNLPMLNSTESMLTIDNETTLIRNYNFNGKSIPAICIEHPSCPNGKRWTYWHKFHNEFLK